MMPPEQALLLPAGDELDRWMAHRFHQACGSATVRACWRVWTVCQTPLVTCWSILEVVGGKKVFRPLPKPAACSSNAEHARDLARAFDANLRKRSGGRLHCTLQPATCLPDAPVWQAAVEIVTESGTVRTRFDGRGESEALAICRALLPALEASPLIDKSC